MSIMKSGNSRKAVGKNREYRGYSIDQICSKYEAETKKKESKALNAADTKERRMINNRIIDLIDLGFPKDQILIRIKKEFPNSKNEKFFEAWVEHHSKNRMVARRREQLGIQHFDRN